MVGLYDSVFSFPCSCVAISCICFEWVYKLTTYVIGQNMKQRQSLNKNASVRRQVRAFRCESREILLKIEAMLGWHGVPFTKWSCWFCWLRAQPGDPLAGARTTLAPGVPLLACRCCSPSSSPSPAASPCLSVRMLAPVQSVPNAAPRQGIEQHAIPCVGWAVSAAVRRCDDRAPSLLQGEERTEEYRDIWGAEQRACLRRHAVHLWRRVCQRLCHASPSVSYCSGWRPLSAAHARWCWMLPTNCQLAMEWLLTRPSSHRTTDDYRGKLAPLARQILDCWWRGGRGKSGWLTADDTRRVWAVTSGDAY